MAGGRVEFVMGNMLDSNGVFYPKKSGFVSAPDAKYYDEYVRNTSSMNFSNGIAGDATFELKHEGSFSMKWGSQNAWFVFSSSPWFVRGGSSSSEYAAIWNSYIAEGSESNFYTSRAIVWSYI